MTEYQVSYDYAARSEKEISLQKGEIILVLKQDSSGWAEGVSTARNVQGWFPISFAAPYSGQSTTTPANTSSSSAADKKKDKKGKRMSTRFFSQGREKVKNALAQQAAVRVTLFFYNEGIRFLLLSRDRLVVANSGDL